MRNGTGHQGLDERYPLVVTGLSFSPDFWRISNLIFIRLRVLIGR